MAKQLTENTKKPGFDKLWCITEAAFVVLGLLYFILYYLTTPQVAVYGLIAFVLVALAAIVLMGVQKRFFTMLLDAVIALLVVLQFIGGVYF